MTPPPPWPNPFPGLPNLVCDDVAGSPAPQAAAYYLWLANDCNGNTIADSGDFVSIVFGNLCEPVEPNPANDCNENGIPDTCEVAKCTCECDFNDDGVLNSQDFFDFLSCFFMPGCTNADFNDDNVVNSQDFFDFLTCFFACGN